MIKTEMEAKGWVMFHECNVCKSRVQYFSRSGFPGYEIRVKPKVQTFRILFNNQTIAGPFWGYELAKKIAEHVK